MFGSKRSAAPISSHLRLHDKVAIIIGAASGIGAVTARLFVSHGAKVLIADIKASAGQKLSLELGSSAHFFRCDVTNEADIAAAVDYAVQAWGHLDIMFNNYAGVSGPTVGLADVNIEELDQVMAVRVKGAVLGVKHAARVMIPVGKGVILFSGSISAEMGGAGPPLHSAANAAVLSIVRSAAAELVRHGIRVNAVSPHCVTAPMIIAAYKASAKPKTDITLEQLERLLAANSELDVLTTEKVANEIMHLAGDDAGFITGNNLVLDGAFSVTKQFDFSNLTAELEKLSPSRDLKAAEKEGQSPGPTVAGSGGGIETNTVTAKEREVDDKARAKEERVREKDEEAAQKALARKEKEDQKEAKAKDKQDKEDEKARAKETKSSAKEKMAPAVTEAVEAVEAGPRKDPISQAAKDDFIHPLDKKASAKEERIGNENIELPNAGLEPDIPTVSRARPRSVRKIRSLLSWRKHPSRTDKTESTSTDVVNVTETTPTSDKSPDLPGVSVEDKKDDTPTEPAKVSEVEEKPLAKDAKAVTEISDSPKTAVSQPKQSSIARITKLLTLGTDPKRSVDKTEGESTNLDKVAMKEEKPAAVDEKAQTDSIDAPQTPAAASKPKQTPTARIARLLTLGKDSKKKNKVEETSTDKGKASEEGLKEDQKSTEPEIENVSTSEVPAKPTANEEKGKEKAETDSTSSPSTTSATQQKQSLTARIVKFFTPRKDSKKKYRTENEAAAQASKEEKKEEKPTEPEQVSKEEVKSPAKEEKAATESTSSPKASAASRPKQSSPQAEIAQSPSPGKDPKEMLEAEDGPTDQDTTPNEDKTDDNSIEPENDKVSAVEAEPAAKEEQVQGGPRTDSPTTGSASKPKKSLVARIVKILTPGKGPKEKGKAEDEAADQGKGSTEEMKDDKPTEPEQVTTAKEEPKPPAEEEKAQTDSADSPLNSAASPPKQAPIAKIAEVLTPGKDSSKGKDKVEDEPGTDQGKVSEGETKDDKLSADPGKESKEDAKPAAAGETAQKESADSPPKTSATTLPKSQSSVAKIANLLRSSKKDDPAKPQDETKEESTDPAAQVEPKEDKKDDKSAEAEKVSTEEAAAQPPPATDEKAIQTEGTDSPSKTAPAAPKKQSFIARIAKLLVSGKGSVRKDKTGKESGTDPAKSSKKEEAL